MKRACYVLVILFILLTCFGTAVFALHATEQGMFVLPKGQVYTGDLFINANKAIIDGMVDGDIYVFAESVQINGEIKGDLISFARDTTIRGKIDGNLRTFTEQATISGTLTRNVTAFTQNLVVASDGHISGSILTFAESVDLLGRVNKNANGFVNNMRITGELGRGTAFLRSGNIYVGSTAKINGDLVYSSPQHATIEPGAQLQGKEVFTQLEPKHEKKSVFFPVLFILMSLLSTLIIWLLLRFLFPRALYQIHQRFDHVKPSMFGFGALLLFGIPILAVVLLISVIGIPIALTLIFSLAILTYVAKIFVGTWLGTRLVRRYHWPLHPLMAEFLGVFAVYTLLQIPFLGWIPGFAVWMMFLGAMGTAIRDTNRISL